MGEVPERAGPEEPRPDVMRVLRHQRHAFLNDLQIISGWLQLRRPEKAQEYIETVKRKQAQLGELFGLANREMLVLLLEWTYGPERGEIDAAWQVESDLGEAGPELVSWVGRSLDQAAGHLAESGGERRLEGHFSERPDAYLVRLECPASGTRWEREFPRRQNGEA